MVKFNKSLAILLLLTSSLAQAELIGQWGLNGDVNDSSGKGYHGQSYDGASATTGSNDWFVNDPVDGNDQSYLFTNGNYIALDTFMDQRGGLTSFSASTWFNTSSAVVTSTFDNWAFLDFDRSEYFNFFLTGTGQVGFSTTSINDNDVATVDDMFSVTDGLNDGQWHHVGVSYDEVHGKQIFIETYLDSTKAYFGGVGTGVTRYAFIGDGSEATVFNGTRNGLYYDGKLSNVKIWNNANDFSVNSQGLSTNLSVQAEVPVPSSLGLLLMATLGFIKRKKAI